MRFCAYGPIGGKELLRNSGIKQVHVCCKVGLFVKETRTVAAKLKSFDLDPAVILAHRFKKIEVVALCIPLEHLQQKLATHHEAIEKCTVSKHDAVRNSRHTTIFAGKAHNI